MQPVAIHITRSGQTEGRALDEQARYIACCDDNPDVDLRIACSQDAFDEHIRLLRYARDTDEAQRLAGISFFQELISKIVADIYPRQAAQIPAGGFLHLRLITTPGEIAQLPFELALIPAQLGQPGEPAPFLLNPGLRATLTREVKKSDATAYQWPSDPRILFAWAQPGNTVPHDDHLDAFMAVLQRWALPMKSSAAPVPDIGRLITELPNAGLAAIQAALVHARKEGRPYTHVHLLAHGTAHPDPATGLFMLVLDDGQGKPYHATGAELSAALTERQDDGVKLVPQVVSLMACDSGNTGDPVNPVGSLAHCLHAADIPCVFASQFPLTQDGSVKLVSALYGQLLQSSDPRVALYNARQSLNTEGTHDWASLIAYARFPDDIDDQIRDIRLKIILSFLENIESLTNHVFDNIQAIRPESIDRYFNDVSQRLDDAIEDLTGAICFTEEDQANKERYAEHYGLIGSAYKRKAEYVYRVAAYKNDRTPQSREASKAALVQARDWYRKGYDKLMSSHWDGTQQLSLSALLDDSAASEDNQEMWIVHKHAAQQDAESADQQAQAWAYGSLAELYLLRPVIYGLAPAESEAALDQARKYLQQLNRLESQDFARESTARQLDRYLHWWPAVLQTPQVNALAAIARSLSNTLT